MSKKKITHPERSMEELIARAVEAAKAPFTPSRKADLPRVEIFIAKSPPAASCRPRSADPIPEKTLTSRDSYKKYSTSPTSYELHH